MIRSALTLPCNVVHVSLYQNAYQYLDDSTFAGTCQWVDLHNSRMPTADTLVPHLGAILLKPLEIFLALLPGFRFL
jgi:hypothetical protein